MIIKKKYQGFTLIEVSLVLAILLALFAVMIFSIQVSISRQRYDDTLVSFRDFLQRQYEEVQNVVVDTNVARASGCVDGDNRNDNDRGRTNCYVIGRLLNFNVIDNNTVVKVEQIMYKTSGNESTSSGRLMYNNLDIVDGNEKIINTSGVLVENYTTEWGAIASWTDGSRIDQSLSVFIFRSPETGAIRTHVVSGRQINSDNIRAMLTPDSLTKNHDICLIPDGNIFGEYRAIRINAGTANASGIELMMPSTNNPMDNEGVKCNVRR